MKYRAIAVNVVKDGHPVQFFSDSRKEADAWARKVSDTEQCTVQVFESREECAAKFMPVYFNPDMMDEIGMDELGRLTKDVLAKLATPLLVSDKKTVQRTRLAVLIPYEIYLAVQKAITDVQKQL